MIKTVSYTIYKNEFATAFVLYLSKKFAHCISYESDTRITFDGIDERVCELIAAEMYTDADSISEVWEDYRTADDEIAVIKNTITLHHEVLRDNLLMLIQSPSYQAGNFTDTQKEYIQKMCAFCLGLGKMRER